MRLQLIAAASAALVVATTFAVTTFQEGETPTEVHETLQRSAGEWEGMITMQGPEGEMQMPASETVTAFGDFWTMSEFSCPMGPDMTYHGRGTFGYDARTEKLVGTWVDNTTSHMSVMEGEIDEETGAHTMVYEAPSSMDPTKMSTHKNVTTHGKDSYTMVFHEKVDGEFVETMRMDMKRKGD